jgi:predicted DNA-binding transcriptional regulator AlpA
MQKREHKLKKAAANFTPSERERLAQQPAKLPTSDLTRLEHSWVTGPTLRKILNISAPTLWRWRRAGNFPIAKNINGRLFFPWHEVAVWLNEQPNAALGAAPLPQCSPRGVRARRRRNISINRTRVARTKTG